MAAKPCDLSIIPLQTCIPIAWETLCEVSPQFVQLFWSRMFSYHVTDDIIKLFSVDHFNP